MKKFTQFLNEARKKKDIIPDGGVVPASKEIQDLSSELKRKVKKDMTGKEIADLVHQLAKKNKIKKMAFNSQQIWAAADLVIRDVVPKDVYLDAMKAFDWR